MSYIYKLSKYMLLVSVSELPGDVCNCSFSEAIVCLCTPDSLNDFLEMLSKVCPQEEMKITLILQLCSHWFPGFEKDKCVWVGNAEPAAAAVHGELGSVRPRGTASSVMVRAMPPSTFAHCEHGANFLGFPSTRGSDFWRQACIHTFHTGTVWNKPEIDLSSHGLQTSVVWFLDQKCIVCFVYKYLRSRHSGGAHRGKLC